MDEIKKENSDNFSSNILPNITHGEKKNLTEKVRKNPWIISTFILGIIILLLVVGNAFGLTGFGMTGKVVSGNTAGENLIGYLEDSGYTAEFSSIRESNGLYLINILINGKEDSVYITKDGNYAITGLIPLSSNTDTDSQTQTQDIPKTEKPSVELYVFTYCPYGLQMEKAMIPVVKLLKDKIDFKIRQIGAMHGEAEKLEAERQLCIEKNYPDKFLDYVLAFAEDTSCPNGAESCITAKLTSLYSKLGIDGNKINSCVTNEGEKLYNAEVQNANSKGIGGSPTLSINGVEAQASRSQDGILTSVCSAFTTSPSECSQKLSTSQASAGFGSETSTTNTHASGSC